MKRLQIDHPDVYELEKVGLNEIIEAVRDWNNRYDKFPKKVYLNPHDYTALFWNGEVKADKVKIIIRPGVELEFEVKKSTQIQPNQIAVHCYEMQITRYF